MPHISPLELIIIALVMFLFFGANKLPDAARSIGQSFKIFKKEMNDVKEATNLTPVVDTEPTTETK